MPEVALLSHLCECEENFIYQPKITARVSEMVLTAEHKIQGVRLDKTCGCTDFDLV